MFQAKEICVPFKNTSSEKDKVKVKNRVVVILQVVYIANVINQKVINVSIVQKISVKRWIIDSNELRFWKNLVDVFCVWNQGTLIKPVLQNICRKYNGKHAISICDKGENRNSHDPYSESLNSIVAFVDQSKSILLQTATAGVFNIETKSSVKTIILFDTRSQRCYVNEKVCKHLSLKTIRT